MRLAAKWLVLFVGFVAGGCGATLDRHTDRDLAAARAFRRFPLYYAGSSVLGMPLVDGGRSSIRNLNAPWGPVDFAYGYCTPEGSGDSARCNPPVDIVEVAACHGDVRYIDPAVRPTQWLRVRGARAAWFGPDDHRLQLTLGRTTVMISAAHLRDAEAVARSLRGVSQAGPLPSLPKPARNLPAQQCESN